MPLHISEIGVHLAVGGAAGTAAPTTEGDGADSPGATLTQAQISEIVARCLQQLQSAQRRSTER